MDEALSPPKLRTVPRKGDSSPQRWPAYDFHPMHLHSALGNHIGYDETFVTALMGY
ncbi:MAG TPA: hypothetical protein VNF75_03445 [Candidatus Dormibacteraeota bacterium]|nr:hypothetical protein [Candidatus Dormibacteraeota bacterium]